MAQADSDIKAIYHSGKMPNKQLHELSASSELDSPENCFSSASLSSSPQFTPFATGKNNLLRHTSSEEQDNENDRENEGDVDVDVDVANDHEVVAMQRRFHQKQIVKKTTAQQPADRQDHQADQR